VSDPGAVRPDLSTPFTLRSRSLRNRMVATAHASGLIADGLAQDGDAEYWGRLAVGGVAMVVSGATIVSAESTVRRGNLVVAYGDEARPGLAKRADAIRGGGAVPISQLIHLGRETLGAESWYAPTAPSAVRTPRAPSPPRALTTEEMPRLIEDFRQGAARCVEAGFEGVELHAAHGYLLDQFLARDTNERHDGYGPGPNGGVRLLTEIVEAIRQTAPDAIVGVRLSAIESLLAFEDVCSVMQRLSSSADIDYLNIAVGDRGRYVADMARSAPPLLPLVNELAGVTTLPLLVSQAFRTDEEINTALSHGADLVGMCRTLIADPEAPRKFIDGRASQVRPCTSCNEDCRLFDPCLLCSVNPHLAPPGHARRPAAPLLLRSAPHSRSDSVCVVGGGPGGLEAAVALAEGGKPVVLYEATERLGGQLTVASDAPQRTGWRRLTDYYTRRLSDLGVSVRLATAPSPRQLEDFGDIIVAVGAEETLPEYGERVGAVTCSVALRNGPDGMASVDHLGVVDDGFGWWPTVGAVELGIAAGVRSITVLTPSGAFATGIPAESRTQLLHRLRGTGVAVHGFLLPLARHGAELTAVSSLSGAQSTFPADLVVTAGPRVPRDLPPLPDGVHVQAIGDCVSARKVAHAISEGREAGCRVLESRGLAVTM
jgi:2,4-dienoyl-CoA reductase-like NADH-dependent reductase (Old Yellow Enzyme family)